MYVFVFIIMAEIDSKKEGEDFKYFGHEIRICECYNNGNMFVNESDHKKNDLAIGC